jgi:phenylalanyl-tRNA synthetase beta chain
VSLGLWRLLARSLGVDAEIAAASAPGFHPGRTAQVTLDGVVIGNVGELTPAAGRHFGIPDRVGVAEVDLEALLRALPPRRAWSPSIYPHVDFDLSFLLDDDLTAGTLLEVTSGAAGSMLERAVVFDEFRSDILGAGKKALAITYRLRASDRTLTADEIAELRLTMIRAAEASGAELRGA